MARSAPPSTKSRLKDHPQPVRIIPVTNPTYTEEYHCVAESSPETSEYRWYRQDFGALPKEVMAKGDRLYFLNSSPELNGLYICTVTNQFGTASGSLYRFKHKHTDLK